MDTWIEQELKELGIYLDDLSRQTSKDAGNLWIAFSDKFNAFKKRLLSESTPTVSGSVDDNYVHIIEGAFELLTPKIEETLESVIADFSYNWKGHKERNQGVNEYARHIISLFLLAIPPQPSSPTEDVNPDTTVFIPVPVSEILGLDDPYPLKDVLTMLATATDKLLHNKSYDGPDYEELGICVKRAKEIVALITAPKPQPAHISADDLCKQLEDMNPHKEKEGGNKQKWIRFGVWNNCVTIVRSLLQGKIITTEQAISDVWEAAIAWYEGELERGTPLPNKSTYLKEKFNTTPQPVKTNEDINYEQAREIAKLAWTAAANAYRMYPDNKHTFFDYWDDYGKLNLPKAAPLNQNEDILVKALEKIQQMSDPGSYEKAIVDMKQLAGEALSSYHTSAGEEQVDWDAVLTWAEKDGWVYNNGQWHQDGYKSRFSKEILELYKKRNK